MPKRIILHVGMHKTASTFLQRDVFPYIPDVYYADKDLIEDTLIHLLNTNPVRHDLILEKEKLDTYIHTLSQDTILISNENLVGWYHQSYYNNQSNTQMLATLFPEAQILMCIRRQTDWLESLYVQTLHHGRSFTVEKFLNWKDGEFMPFRPVNSLNGTMDVRLNPLPFVLNYQQTFGKDNVLVLPYERFSSDMATFLDAFYAFSGLQPYYPKKTRPVNRSYSMVSAHLAFHLNRWIKNENHRLIFRNTLKKRLDKWFYIPTRFIDDNKRAKLQALHADNNRALAELIQQDLSQFGYYEAETEKIPVSSD